MTLRQSIQEVSELPMCTMVYRPCLGITVLVQPICACAANTRKKKAKPVIVIVTTITNRSFSGICGVIDQLLGNVFIKIGSALVLIYFD